MEVMTFQALSRVFNGRQSLFDKKFQSKVQARSGLPRGRAESKGEWNQLEQWAGSSASRADSRPRLGPKFDLACVTGFRHAQLDRFASGALRSGEAKRGGSAGRRSGGGNEIIRAPNRNKTLRTISLTTGPRWRLHNEAAGMRRSGQVHVTENERNEMPQSSAERTSNTLERFCLLLRRNRFDLSPTYSGLFRRMPSLSSASGRARTPPLDAVAAKKACGSGREPEINTSV